MSNVLDFQVSGSFPSKVGGTGTTVKYFPRPLGPSIGVAPSTPSATSAAGVLLLPAQNVFNGQQFLVLASGSIGNDSGDPSGTMSVQLYAVTGTASVPVYTSIAASTISTNFPGAQPWGLFAELVGDSDSGILTGAYQAYNRDTVTAPTVITSRISGLDFNLGNAKLAQGAVLGFVVGVTFGTSDATNKASLYEFTIES